MKAGGVPTMVVGGEVFGAFFGVHPTTGSTQRCGVCGAEHPAPVHSCPGDVRRPRPLLKRQEPLPVSTSMGLGGPESEDGEGIDWGGGKGLGGEHTRGEGGFGWGGP